MRMPLSPCPQFTVYSTAGDTDFDGEVQFKLEGPAGTDTGCLTLGSGGADSGLFKAGARDAFNMRGRDVGTPTKLVANINYRSGCSNYALSRVEVLNSGTGERAVFRLGDTLHTWNWWTEVPVLGNVDYQVIAGTLCPPPPLLMCTPSPPSRDSPASLQISTTTSNTSSRSFDGQVYVTLAGADGMTQEVQLLPPWDGASLFQPSATDSFYVNALNVGQLKQLSVRLAPGASGAACKWSLEYIDVHNTSSGVQVRRLGVQRLGRGSCWQEAVASDPRFALGADGIWM
jgi:hypothetical protein